jgi:hypothetical protein
MATVSETTRSTRITLGSLTAGPFLVGFRLFDSDGLKVFVDGEPSTAYTLTANFDDGYDDDAEILLDDAFPEDTVVQIDGALIPGRSDDYVNPDPGLTEKINIELARMWAAISENRMLALRSVRSLEEIPATDGVSGANFAEASAAAEETILARDEVLAIQQTLPQWQSSWLTATVYEFADLVYESGSTYFCTVPHTSGTFSTDLAAMKWEVFAQKGASGAGTGDVLAANNGSDFANAATVRTNLGLAIGTNVQAYNQLLGAVSGLASNGLMARLSGSTAAARTITGTANQLTVTNGDGVSGNPTIAAVIASQAEAEAGTDTTKLMTAERTAQAIATLASQGRVLLASKTASASANLSFPEMNNSVYRFYELEMEDVRPTTDATILLMRFSSNAGVSYDNAASDYAWTNTRTGTTVDPDSDVADSQIQITSGAGVGNAGGEKGVSGCIKIYNAGSGTTRTRVIANFSYENASGILIIGQATGVRLANQDTDAVLLFFSSGTIASGTIHLYGLL